MSDHERSDSPLLLGERQELRRKFAHLVTVESHVGVFSMRRNTSSRS